jgi:hypothetical protein
MNADNTKTDNTLKFCFGLVFAYPRLSAFIRGHSCFAYCAPWPESTAWGVCKRILMSSQRDQEVA